MDDPTSVMREKFAMSNGLLIPGGGSGGTSTFAPPALLVSAQRLYEWAHDEGNYPIHGTCLGHEILLTLVAEGDTSVIEDLSGSDYVTKLQARKETLLSRFSRHIPWAFTSKAIFHPLMYFNHMHGITRDSFENDPRLTEVLRPIVNATDLQGTSFIAAFESLSDEVPLSGFQFHPEKAQYEWHRPSNVNHEKDAIVLSSMLAFAFVDRAALNEHRPSPPGDEERYLIHRTATPTYTGDWPSDPASGEPFPFEEIYLFDPVH